MNILLKTYRSAILEIAKKHGILDVRVFGSFVRDEVSPTSDIDLLIQPGPQVSFFFPGGFVAELEDILHRRVDVVTEQGLHPLLREHVLNEAVPL